MGCKELYVPEFLALPISKRKFDIKKGDVILVRNLKEKWKLAIFGSNWEKLRNPYIEDKTNFPFFSFCEVAGYQQIIKYSSNLMDYIDTNKEIPNAFSYTDALDFDTSD